MIGAAIYSILSNHAALTAITATRIYPDIAPQNVAFPFCVYAIDGATPSDTKDGASPLNFVRFTVMSYSNSYDQAQSMANAVRGALGAKTAGTFGGVSLQSIRFADQQSGQMEIGQHVYLVEQTFNARVNG